MCLRTMKELRGGEVLARDGRIGALDDLYFDREYGQVRYLVVPPASPSAGIWSSPRPASPSAALAGRARALARAG